MLSVPIKHQQILYIGLAIALLLRLAFMVLPFAFYIDMDTFKAWAIALDQNGLDSFYVKTWSDYPPGYLLILAATGKFYHLVHSLFAPLTPNIQANTDDLTFLIKLPPAIADIASAWMIWLILKSRTSESISLTAALLYVFNPVIILVSAIWGQADSVTTFLMLVILWMLGQNQFIGAGILGIVSVVIKPQGIFLLPIFTLSQWDKRSWWQWVAAIALGFLSLLLIVLPFIWTKIHGLTGLDFWIYPWQFLYAQFSSGADNYPFASVNAFNIWIGANWRSENLKILGVSYRDIGLVLLSTVLVWVGIFLRQDVNKANYPKQSSLTTNSFPATSLFLATTVVMMAIFMLPTRMHERYIFYAIAPLIITSALMPVISGMWWLYWGVTVTSFINISYVFIQYIYPELFSSIFVGKQDLILLGIAIANVGIFMMLIWQTFLSYLTRLLEANKMPDDPR